MHLLVQNLINIKDKIKTYLVDLNKKNQTKIIAVSKTFKLEKILPLIEYGHVHFGENKVQEALDKWSEVKKNDLNIKLHMIGKLQTNKVKFAVKIFDYIHSVDSEKLAKKISEEQNKINKKIKVFIQVNIGNEDQKAGININEVPNFYEICRSKFNLNIIGLMCIPPMGMNINKYFNSMKNLNNSLGLKELSMGMSSDYIDAIDHGSTYVRIGSKIFGNRV